jgi:hypothetical protein
MLLEYKGFPRSADSCGETDISGRANLDTRMLRLPDVDRLMTRAEQLESAAVVTADLTTVAIRTGKSRT